MNKYGISELSVIPVRKEPDDRSEMITQLLFGETFHIVEETKKWNLIKNTFDNYEGWIDKNSVSILSEDYFQKIISVPELVTQHLSNTVLNAQNEKILLPAGSSLPNYINENKTFQIKENQYSLLENYSTKIDLRSLTKQFLNCPYLWGGKNPYGIDCSGFVQIIFKILGNKLPRDAQQQVKMGNSVSFINEIKLGDLAFFDDEEGNIVHVGIVLNEDEIIHASGKVRIDKLDQQGIYNFELKKYTHKLRLIKRIL